jgi:hypothetical protein
MSDHCEIHCHSECPGGEAVRDWTGKRVRTADHLSKDLKMAWTDGKPCPMCDAGMPEPELEWYYIHPGWKLT